MTVHKKSPRAIGSAGIFAGDIINGYFRHRRDDNIGLQQSRDADPTALRSNLEPKRKKSGLHFHTRLVAVDADDDHCASIILSHTNKTAV